MLYLFGCMQTMPLSPTRVLQTCALIPLAYVLRFTFYGAMYGHSTYSVGTYIGTEHAEVKPRGGRGVASESWH